jgi:hypothetical protein
VLVIVGYKGIMLKRKVVGITIFSTSHKIREEEGTRRRRRKVCFWPWLIDYIFWTTLFLYHPFFRAKNGS